MTVNVLFNLTTFLLAMMIIYSIHQCDKYYKKVLDIMDILDEKEEEIDELTDTVKTLEDKITELEKSIDSIDTDVLDGTFLASTFQRDMRESIAEEVERACEAFNSDIQSSVEDLESKIEDLANEDDPDLSSKLEDLEAKIDKIRAAFSSLANDLED